MSDPSQFQLRNISNNRRLQNRDRSRNEQSTDDWISLIVVFAKGITEMCMNLNYEVFKVTSLGFSKNSENRKEMG